MPFPPSFDVRLVAARALTAGGRELTFERVDRAPMAFEPGQWVNLLVPTAPGAPGAPAEAGAEPGLLKRSYSIASAPDGSARFALAVTRVQGGPASTALHALEPDAVLTCVGPQGFFTRPATGGPPSLFIATGPGLTPKRSMLRAAIAAGSTTPMWILLGVRNEGDLLYADELQRRRAAAHPFVRFEPSLSQPEHAWRERGNRAGYVQTHVRALWDELAAAQPQPPHAYVCGLERMVGSVRDLLRKEMGLPRQQVHSERYD